MSTGDRGKSAESKVRAACVRRAEQSNFAFYRWPDARAGSFAVTPADFLIVAKGEACLLEVKEVAHEFRLAHKNFSTDQAARMSLFAHAGASSWVLIHFTKSKLWRIVPLGMLQVRSGGSWDLSNHPTFPSADAAMCMIFDME